MSKVVDLDDRRLVIEERGGRIAEIDKGRDTWIEIGYVGSEGSTAVHSMERWREYVEFIMAVDAQVKEMSE